MSVIARCERCGYEYIVRADRTVSLACDCSLRDPDTPWSVAEMVSVTLVEALKARLRQEVDAHRMTLHEHALPMSDEEFDELLGTIPGFEEGP